MQDSTLWTLIISALGIIATQIISIISLLRQNKLLRSATGSQIAGRVFEINRLLVEHPELSHLDKPYVHADSFETGDSRTSYVDLLLSFYEEVYVQYTRYGLLEKEDWESWIVTIVRIAKRPYVLAYWQVVKGEYSPGFRKFVDEMLQQST